MALVLIDPALVWGGNGRIVSRRAAVERAGIIRVDRDMYVDVPCILGESLAFQTEVGVERLPDLSVLRVLLGVTSGAEQMS